MLTDLYGTLTKYYYKLRYPRGGYVRAMTTKEALDTFGPDDKTFLHLFIKQQNFIRVVKWHHKKRKFMVASNAYKGDYTLRPNNSHIPVVGYVCERCTVFGNFDLYLIDRIPTCESCIYKKYTKQVKSLENNKLHRKP